MLAARSAERPRPAATPVRPGRAYLNGVVSNLCNPKIGVFFVAFLPAFVPGDTPARLFSFGLGIWFVVETGLWLSVLVWMISRGIGWFGRSGLQRRMEQITGLVLIGFGIRLATEAR